MSRRDSFRLRTSPTALWLAALLAGGCGADAAQYDFVRTERTRTPATEGEGEGEGDGRDEGDGAIPDEPLEDWDVEGADPLSGIFVVETTIKARLIIDLEAHLVHRLRLVRRGTHVRQRFTLCDVELPSVENVAELTIPPRLRSLMQSIPADSEGDFFESEAATGVAYVPQVPNIEIGPDDDDDDGHPGVTVTATAFVCTDEEGAPLEVEVYASLKVGAGISGIVVDVDTLEGAADPTLEQEILGWSDQCISLAAGLKIEILPGSTWRARRVLPEHDIDGNGNVSCPEILRTRVGEPETDAETP